MAKMAYIDAVKRSRKKLGSNVKESVKYTTIDTL